MEQHYKWEEPWLELPIPRKDKIKARQRKFWQNWVTEQETRKDKTMGINWKGSDMPSNSKTPSPGFDDVQQEGAAYYGQFEAFYYTAKLLETARELFTSLALHLESYHSTKDEMLVEQCKSLLGQCCLIVGALCDAFNFDLEDIVKEILGV